MEMIHRSLEKSLYISQISEDSPIGTTVMTVSATDKDIRPKNSHFSYSFENESLFFNLGTNTGIVTVAGKLDRETISQHNLTIRAIDNGSPPGNWYHRRKNCN